MQQLLARILSVAEEFVAWLWGNVSPPKRKKWGAIFYYVAQQDAGVSYPETGLDVKLDVTLAALKAANFDAVNTHVAYRTVWANPSKLPFASVLHRPATWAHFFPGCSLSYSTPVATGSDLGCFLKWAYKWCPADHYAIFFWGHSFGPAGLFEPGGPITIPRPPGLQELREAFEQFMAERAKDQPAPRAVNALSPPTSGAADAADAIEDSVSPNPKVEVVVFQDCWMSTLETAFELRDVTSYLVASQSLVPIGGTAPDFVWPYEELLKDLKVSPASARAKSMCNRLVDFYVKQRALGRISHLTSVPWAVLRLSAVPATRNKLTALAQHLLTRADRATLIGSGVIAPFNGSDLTAGDPALVDVPLMCGEMVDSIPDDAMLDQRAKDLRTALALLIPHKKAEPQSNPDGFGGVSVLYRPPYGTVSQITPVVIDSFYTGLRMPQETGWPALENP